MFLSLPSPLSKINKHALGCEDKNKNTMRRHFTTTMIVTIVTRKGPGWRQVCPGTVWNVWALDFVQERFHDTSPGDFESTFIKAGDSKTKGEIKIKESRSQQPE